MTLNLEAKQIANFDNDISIYDTSREYIDKRIKPFLKKENIGKYIIFRDDSGEAQTDRYKARKIINETGDKSNPFITLSSKEEDVYVFSYLRGGRSKTKYRRSRVRRLRRFSRRQKKYYNK